MPPSPPRLNVVVRGARVSEGDKQQKNSSFQIVLNIEFGGVRGGVLAASACKVFVYHSHK